MMRMMGFCSSCGLVYPEGHNFCPLDGSKLVEQADPLLGRVLAGSYRLVELIGEGGMGKVFRALHMHRDRQVAVKVLASVMTHMSDEKERFLREARAAALIRHENIVEVFELEEMSDGILFMAMELLEGENLAEALEDGPMPVERIVPILRQVCGALGPLHALGIVHRDLKPDNIFLIERNGTRDFVKLLDFGLARMANEPGITSQNIILGTPDYMAPEIVTGEEPGPPADIYSLGCVAYTMAAGRTPFDGPSSVQIMSKQISEQPAPLPGSVPMAFCSIVSRLMQKEPRYRYPDAFAVMRELDAFIPPPFTAERVSTLEIRSQQPPEIRPSLASTMVGSWKDLTRTCRSLADTGHHEVLDKMDSCAGKLETVHGRMKDLSRTVQELENERHEIAARIRNALYDLAQEASETRISLMSRRSQLNEYEEGISTLSGAPRRGLEEKARALRSEVAELESRIEDYSFQIDALRTRLNEVGNRIDGKLNESRADLDALEKERASIEAQLCHLTSRLPGDRTSL
jgi:serine/threonine-protein kinase